jgi:capsular polysaccharide biosynthesis protein
MNAINGSDPAVTWPLGTSNGLSARFSSYDDAVLDDRFPGDSATGLVSLGFIGGALRRGIRIWCAIGVLGLLIGSVVYLKFPLAYKATTSVLLVNNPDVDPTTAVQTDAALAQSTAVATGVVHQLGLRQTPSSLLGSYTVTVDTIAVLTITASGPNSSEAVQRASAIATQFLKFRDQYAQMQQNQTEAQLNQQVSQAQQHLNLINAQLSQASSPSDINKLRAESNAASNALQQVQQYATQTLATARTTTQAIIRGSVVINAAAPAKRSILGSGALYAVIGLAGGIVLGMAIVIIGAITSDRLLRRDDIAYAFGAPVRLSVGPLHEGVRLPELPGRAAKRHRDMERVIGYLRNAVPGSSRGPVGLAVVAVDDVRSVARVVAALAVSCAKQGQRVVIADLSPGTRAAHLLGARRPGISAVNADGVQVTVVVPAADDVAPVGPFGTHASPDGYEQAGESLAAVCRDADLVLTLTALDPASGGEYLPTWATDAVAVVTAGESTAVRIHAVGEMIRLAGTRLGSVVVLDAEKRDESIGALDTVYQSHVASEP